MTTLDRDALPFIPGLGLSGTFYDEAVRPFLDTHFPDLPHSAALLGTGSEVLGFDTAQSMDHNWGPRLFLFLRPEDLTAYGDRIEAMLRQDVPSEIHGIPINLAAERSDPPPAPQTPRHGVTLTTVDDFFREQLGFVPDHDLTPGEWLTIPEQLLRTMTAGRVYHDGLGQLKPIRERLRYYPHDVWLYIMAVQWVRIGEEEAFVGRSGQMGDELGSAVVGARLVRDIMRLCFLMERQYAPYSKWLGTAFSRLDCAAEMTPHLLGALRATDWREREQHLSAAYIALAQMHNVLGVSESVAAEVSLFHERPFNVIHGDRFMEALRAEITDEAVLALPPRLGSVDQYIDSTPVLSDPAALRQLLNLD